MEGAKNSPAATAEAAEAAPATFDDLVRDHLERVEDPDPDTVSHEQQKLAAELGQAVQTDEAGHVKIHKTLGRPKFKTGPKGKTAEERAAEAREKLQKLSVQYHALGAATAQTIFLMATMLGGEEFQPAADEVENVTTAWATYYEAKGISDVPPEVHLAGAMLAYVGPRLLNPAVRARIVRKIRGEKPAARAHAEAVAAQAAAAAAAEAAA